MVVAGITCLIPDVKNATVSDVVMAPITGMIGVSNDELSDAVTEAMNEEGVDAADASQDKEEVAQPVCSRGVSLVGDPLAAHHVSETNSAEGHKAEVE